MSGDQQRAGNVEVREVWERCRCDQWGRCLTDCPSAELTPPAVGWLWNVRLGEWIDRG